MFVVVVELLHGTFRADALGTAHTGNLTEGEWPPSPSRLFAALVAADGTRDRCRHTDGSELLWLEAQPSPSILASGPGDVRHSRVEPRYVVQRTEKPTGPGMQEYVGRKGAEVRPGIRVSPPNRMVVYRWPTDPPEHIRAALSVRAARIGYLGCADSSVRVSIAGEAPPAAPTFEFSPSPEGATLIAVPEAGTVDRLDAHHDIWCERGPSVRRSQSPGLTTLATYRVPGEIRARTELRPTVLWFRLERPISGRRVLAATEALRGALLARYGPEGAERPPVLHGHGYTEKGHDTARYLALPNVGSERADGRVHGMAVWLPAGTAPEVASRCRGALGVGVHLRGPGIDVGLVPWAGDERPWSANPRRWQESARWWSSAFPVVHERSNRRVDLGEVGRWCRHAGLPQPVAYRSGRHPFLGGGVDLAPSEVNRRGRPARRYGHVEVVFDRDVQGPIAIGAGRQFGLGLMAAVGDRHE